MTYQDAVKRVIEPYGNMMAVYMPESEDTLGSPVIQYGETDWEFIIRLASRLHMPVYADYLSGEAGFKFGMVKGELVNTQVNSYHVGISSQYYKSRNNMPRENYLYYTIISDENYQIGDKLHIGGCTYTIFKKCAELVCEKLKFTYWAGNSGNWYIPEIEHRWLSGMELTGTVVDTKEETVNIRLKMDESYGGAEHEWNWEPASGNIMYAMPEKGTQVRLCFGSEEAEEGSAAVSIRENGGSMPEQQNRGFMSKPDKKLEMYPENLSFSGKGGEASVSDGDKIFFSSAGKVKITASDIIRFDASSISVQTPLEINMYKSSAQSEKRKEDICERGTKSNPPTGGDDSGFTMNFEFNIFRWCNGTMYTVCSGRACRTGRICVCDGPGMTVQEAGLQAWRTTLEAILSIKWTDGEGSPKSQEIGQYYLRARFVHVCVHSYFKGLSTVSRQLYNGSVAIGVFKWSATWHSIILLLGIKMPGTCIFAGEMIQFMCYDRLYRFFRYDLTALVLPHWSGFSFDSSMYIVYNMLNKTAGR